MGCLAAMTARGADYPWTMLVPEHDSRDPEMVAQDETRSMKIIAAMNESEPLLHQNLTWHKTSIRSLLQVQAPFCEMHFDAINPVGFTASEKRILAEYLKRGGFVLFYVDTYPYPQADFWKVKEWPVIDFLTRELPALDPAFTVGRASDDDPIFRVHYRTQTADAIRHELTGNPNTPNRTQIFYKGRLCCFVMGDYAYLEGGEWVPFERPFPTEYTIEEKSYELIVNIYVYAITN